MSNFIIALLFSVGAATWVYTKFMKSTGSNTRNSVVVAFFCGILLFLVVYIALDRFITW